MTNAISFNKELPRAVVLGAGLSGLAAGYRLNESGFHVSVLESSPTVGGLSKTISHNGYLFDLGGHRFLTKNKEIENFVLNLLQDDVLDVPRKSKIFMRDRYFDYPLKPLNATFGLGMTTTAQIIIDYIAQRFTNLFIKKDIVSLEDWVVNQFGRKMFDLYFKEYTEKVWGIPCDRICMEWVAQRIKGLSLGKAIKNAFFKFSGKDLLTLSDHFFYPTMGIGVISDRMSSAINSVSQVLTKTPVCHIFHDDKRITGVAAGINGYVKDFPGTNFISSIPLTKLIRMLNPKAPDYVIDACNQLKFRDLVIVTLMLDREQVTDLTWMYLPEKDIPLGRIHEPKNWSPFMAPEGKTHIVAEYFCFENDGIWNSTDEELKATTVEHLERLDFIKSSEVLDCCVLRKPKAYPIFEVGYHKHYDTILNYLKGFENLHIVGRAGKFKYYNMDHAIESGLEAAQNIINKSPIQ